MMIRYQESHQGIAPNQLHGFFEGWPNPPTPETHLKIIQSSDYVVLAIDEDSNNVLGFVTAISDGVLSAYIPLLEVLSDFRNQGIGEELVRRMLGLVGDFYMIDLLCDFDLEHFYDRFGFKPAFGMMLRNYDQQSGRNSS